jgi:hypothetical protein
MVRTQIQLTEQQFDRLREWARRRGVSLAEAVRRCVADRLASDEDESSGEDRKRRALAVCGKYRDPHGTTRIARDHDAVLAEAYRK